jgi:hypothetical protein
MDNYNIEQIKDSNYDLTKTLYKNSFRVNHSISTIKRKYDTSVFGHKNIGYFAVTPDKRPAAFYGVFPIIMTINSIDVPVAQSGDTMTAPDHRNKGLFVLLAKKTYELAEENGIQIIFGFPNENSFPGFKKKLDWQFIGSMQKFSIRNSILPLCEIASKLKTSASCYEKYCNFRLSKYRIALTEENIAPFNLIKSIGFIKKDINFFQYKLSNPDNSLISINNFTLLIKPRTHLIIGDVGFFDKTRTSDFIQTLKKLANILGCKNTIICVSKNYWLFDYLKSIIVPIESLPIGFLPFNQKISLKDISFTQADYDTF